MSRLDPDHDPFAPTPAEEWRRLPDTPFEVSDRGRMRRCEPAHNQPVGFILKNHLRLGYHTVGVSISNKKRSIAIHQAVARVFIGPPPQGCHVNHIDGNKLNNHPSNLEYVTPAENTRHAARLGLMATGDRNGSRLKPERLKRGRENPAAKLDEQRVREIRALKGTAPHHVIAARFGMSRPAITAILCGRLWQHVRLDG